MPFIVGIDLGTSTTIVAFLNDETPESCPDPDVAESQVTPSAVMYPDDGPTVVGHYVINMRGVFPDQVVVEAKRSIGSQERFPRGAPRFLAHEILAEIIYKRLLPLPAIAAAHGETEIHALISVPAYYGNLERKRTEEAWQIAVDRLAEDAEKSKYRFCFQGLVDEPLAAAIYQCYHTTDLFTGEPLMVFDLGGGTFDVTIFNAQHLADEDCLAINVFAKDGEEKLGGADWDLVLAQMWVDKAGIELDDLTAQELCELLEDCQRQRPALGQVPLVRIRSPRHGMPDLDVTRPQFEAACADLLDRIDACLDRVVTGVKREHGLDERAYRVLLVGGATHMPMVQELVRNRFGAARVSMHHSPQQAVARGTCLFAGICQGVQFKNRALRNIRDIRVFDIVTRSYGVVGYRHQTYGLKVVIPRNSICNDSEYLYRDLAVKEDGLQIVRLAIGASAEPAEQGDFLELDPANNNIAVQEFELVIPESHATVKGQPIYVMLRPRPNSRIEGRASLRDPIDHRREICEIAIELIDR